MIELGIFCTILVKLIFQLFFRKNTRMKHELIEIKFVENDCCEFNWILRSGGIRRGIREFDDIISQQSRF